MQLVRRNPKTYHRRAGVAVPVALSGTMIFAMGALVLDMGRLYTAQTELQVAADSAALAAASQLLGEGDVDPHAAALEAANEYAGLNPVMKGTPVVLPEDVEFGRAAYDPCTQRFEFELADVNSDAVRVTVRRLDNDPDDPFQDAVHVPYVFAQLFGPDGQSLQAHATAVLIPRDISVVIDLSNSMCFDSQLRYWNRSDGGYSNLRDVWCALDGPEPEQPYIPGSELETEYAGDDGPAIGNMVDWGDPLLPGEYDASTDPGLFYLPRNVDWTGDAVVEQALVDAGYDDWERWSILTNETQGYLTPQVTDDLGFSSRVLWQEGSSYGRDRVTIYLTSDGSGATPALSHLTISLPYCARALATSTAESQGGYFVETVSPDPKTGFSGIKFDETALGEDGVVETEWFTFEVPSSCNLGGIDVACKAGRGYAAANQEFESVDPWNTTRWRYRVATVLGLLDWDSGMDGSGGDDDSLIDGSDGLSWLPKPSFRVSWSWSSFLDYCASSSRGIFRYRFGPKTFTDFLLECAPQANQTNNLWATPEQPLRAVKDAVKTMTDVIIDLDSMDQVSLEIFGATSRHEVDLSLDVAQVPDLLYQRQSGHYDRNTNIGGGMSRAVAELSSERARGAAAKIIVLMSDGSANIDENGNYSLSGAREYALEMAQEAADEGFRIYCVSVGYGSDRDLMEQIASIGHGEEFFAAGDPETYTAQLEEIFRSLGGKRPVVLIE